MAHSPALRFPFLLSSLVMGAWGAVPAAHADDVAVSVATLLREATDLSRLPLPRAWTVHLDSSYDRTGGNKDQQNFLSIDGGTALLADLHGPGALVRIWTTSVTQIDGHLTSFQTGILKIYIDDQEKPVIDTVCGTLCTGKVPPFIAPLTVINGAASYSYLPIPFAHHCRVTIDRPAAEFFYQINAIRLPEGTVVRPFTLPLNGEDEEAARAAVTVWSQAAQPPSAASASGTTASGAVRHDLIIPAGQAVEIPALTGPGTVSLFGLAAPHVSDAGLRRMILRVWFDGHATPDIEAPVADFFGNAYGHAVFSSLILAQDADGMMTCRLPMPFTAQARIGIENGAAEDAAVTVALTVQPAGPARGGLLPARGFQSGDDGLRPRPCLGAHPQWSWAFRRRRPSHAIGTHARLLRRRRPGPCRR